MLLVLYSFLFYSYSIYMPYIHLYAIYPSICHISIDIPRFERCAAQFPPQRGRPTAARGTSRCRCRWTPQRPGQVPSELRKCDRFTDIAWNCWVYGKYNELVHGLMDALWSLVNSMVYGRYLYIYYGKSPFWIGKSTISMAMFYTKFLLVFAHWKRSDHWT